MICLFCVFLLFVLNYFTRFVFFLFDFKANSVHVFIVDLFIFSRFSLLYSLFLLLFFSSSSFCFCILLYYPITLFLFLFLSFRSFFSCFSIFLVSFSVLLADIYFKAASFSVTFPSVDRILTFSFCCVFCFPSVSLMFIIISSAEPKTQR